MPAPLRVILSPEDDAMLSELRVTTTVPQRTRDRAAGERSYQVLSHENDLNQVVHFSSWTSIAAAKQFFEFPELIQIRLEAGVKSPEFIYLNQLESGTL